MAPRLRALWLLPLLSGLLAACDARLPEPDSPGARLYAERCSSGCHRIYAPSLIKPDMWKITVQRMEPLIERAGQPAITPSERTLLLDYLAKHSG